MNMFQCFSGVGGGKGREILINELLSWEERSVEKEEGGKNLSLVLIGEVFGLRSNKIFI